MKPSDIRATYASAAEAARLLGVSVQRVHALRGTPGFPPMEKLWNVYIIPRKELMDFARLYRIKRRRPSDAR